MINPTELFENLDKNKTSIKKLRGAQREILEKYLFTYRFSNPYHERFRIVFLAKHWHAKNLDYLRAAKKSVSF